MRGTPVKESLGEGTGKAQRAQHTLVPPWGFPGVSLWLWPFEVGITAKAACLPSQKKPSWLCYPPCPPHMKGP